MRDAIPQREHGGAKFKALLALLILAALVFSAIEIVPVFVNNYDLQDAIQQEARFAFNPETGQPKTTDQMRSEIEQKAQKLGLPIQQNQIQVTKNGSSVSISVDYTVPVDLKFYQLQLHFHPQADNASL